MFKFLVVTVFILFATQNEVNSTDSVELSNDCIGCICEASSSCNNKIGCKKGVCGLLGLTEGYWADAGKLTVEGDNPDSPNAFKNCAFNATCASNTMKAYTKKYKKDCNKDGKIDCIDYVYIHQLGGFSCTGKIPKKYINDVTNCMKTIEDYKKRYNL